MNPIIIYILFVFLIITIGIALYQILKTRKEEDQATEELNWNIGKVGDLNWSLEEGKQKYVTERRLVTMIIGMTTLIFTIVFFAPAYSVYATLTKINPFYSIFVIYFSYFFSIICIVSSIIMKPIYNIKVLRIGFLIILTLMLIDLWTPKMVITGEGKINLIKGYRASVDYMLLTLYKDFIPTKLLEWQIYEKISLIWILVYVGGTLLFTFLIYLIISLERGEYPYEGKI